MIAHTEDRPRQSAIGTPRIRKTKNEINKTALIIYLPSLTLLFPKQTSRQYSIR